MPIRSAKLRPTHQYPIIGRIRLQVPRYRQICSHLELQNPPLTSCSATSNLKAKHLIKWHQITFGNPTVITMLMVVFCISIPFISLPEALIPI
ncbi:hypothetical protein EMCG_07490 [[Emmonsia] crescens]|uniref:Uncharacterized protein n=1 Tax=[Emmonsia] crescens TaxID=73230 RepID=A0A0G2J5K5_9EURO|nr:hypothetical protein EMCG_07490 [Emmonsia crescens UAMH 3008]